MSIGLGMSQRNKEIYVDRARANENKRLGEERLKQEQLQIEAMRQTQESSINRQNTENEQITLELRKLGMQQWKDSMFRATNSFIDSGSVSGLNYMLRQTKQTGFQPEFMKNISRFDKLDLENDKDLLKQAGVNQVQLDELDGKVDGNIDWDKVKNRYLKEIHSDGQVFIRDIIEEVGGMGMKDWMEQKSLSRLQQLANLEKPQNNESRTSMQKNASAVSEAKERIEQGKGTKEDKALLEMHQVNIGGTKAGNLQTSKTAGQEWYERGYDELTPEEIRNNLESLELLYQRELAHGLSDKDRETLKELAPLIGLADEASKLSPDSAGLWDKYSNSVFRKVQDDADLPAQAKASYGAFINAFRHELFGSALTTGELNAFAEAYGTLNDQPSYVLTGLRSAVIQVRDKLKMVANLNDSIVVQARMGMTLKDLTETIKGLEQKVEFLRLAEEGYTPEEIGAKLKVNIDSSSQEVNQTEVDEVTKYLFGDK